MMPPRRAHRAAATLALALGAAASWIVPAGPATARPVVLTTTEYSPYCSTALPRGGVLVDLAVTALRQAGHTAEVRFMPWARALSLGQQGEVDGVLCIWKSPAREQDFVFSDPLVTSRIMLCRRPGPGPERFTGFSDLPGATVGVVRGYALPPSLAGAGVPTREVTSDLQGLRMLMAGRFDFMLMDDRVAQQLMTDHTDLQGISCLEPALQTPEQFMALSRKVPDAAAIIQAFNQALRQMAARGELQRILGTPGAAPAAPSPATAPQPAR